MVAVVQAGAMGVPHDVQPLVGRLAVAVQQPHAIDEDFGAAAGNAGPRR
jgi:hypothetical protein